MTEDRGQWGEDRGATMTHVVPPLLLRGWIVPVGDAIPDRRVAVGSPNPLAREVADIFISLTRNENSAMTV